MFRAAAAANGFADFARELERENNRLRAALQRIADYDAPDAHAMIQQAKAALG